MSQGPETEKVMRHHFSKSLKEVHGGLQSWVLERPAWLQPPLRGALLIYGFVLWRGGLIVVPIALLVFLFGPSADRAVIGPALLAILVYAPAAGFLGGLAYASTKSILDRLGAFGRYLKFILGTWVYCVVLVFFIAPVFKPEDRTPLSDPFGWVISAAMAVVFGLALSVQSDDVKSETRRSRLTGRTISLIWIGVAVCQLGWLGIRWAGEWPALVGFAVAFGSLFIASLVTLDWFSQPNNSAELPANHQPKPPHLDN
jgi:hypothetical protein